MAELSELLKLNYLNSLKQDSIHTICIKLGVLAP